jgi:streptogrisin C
MRKLSSWALGGLILSALFVTTIASAAGAPDDVSPAVRSAMQRDLGLTAAQLSQYLKIEHLAAMEEKRLAAAQGNNFGGSWIERKPDGDYQLVVATTWIPQGRGPADVEFRGVRHTQLELEASKTSLDDVLAGGSAPEGVYSWQVDLPSNSVVVSIGKGQEHAAIDFVAASGADSATIRFVVDEEQPSLRSTLKGGLGYLRNPGDGYLYACSIGFNVTKGSAPAYVSAGHCGTAGEPVYFEGSAGTGPQWSIGPQIGTFSASKFPQPGQTGNDYSYVTVVSGNTLPATVYGWGSGDATVHGGTAAGVGTAVCRSGRTSGWKCGTIEATGVTVSYSSGETILNLTRTTACSEGGDSGGSFITGPGLAQGVLSGGSGSCKGKLPNKRTRSFFQPLGPILSAYGLTLTTG